MFIYLLLILILQLRQFEAAGTELNVGTVLFTKADTYKECWSSENVALLTSRMILEDLLPCTSILIIDSNDFVCALVEYFRIILETVRHNTKGKNKHLTLLALTDLLGGYLFHAVLPIAKFSFYSGLIDYDAIESLMALFDELKWFLRTNGQGWASPLQQSCENFDIQRLTLTPCGDSSVCNNLIVAESQTEQKGPQCEATIPIPFFDSRTKPCSVALPTKRNPLYNLEASNSSYLIMNFFLQSYHCLQSKNTNQKSMKKFITDYSTWIEQQIIPRLADERFYSAFGGILRVHLTLKRLIVQQSHVNKKIESFEKVQLHENHENMPVAPPVEPQKPAEATRSNMILTALLITIFVWFILGTMFICYRMSASNAEKNKSKPGGASGSGPRSTITSSSGWTKKSTKPSTRKIEINTCVCGDDESSAVIDTSHSEHKLPSITEISESCPSSCNRKITFPKSPNSTTCGSSSERRCHGGEPCYPSSDSDETSDAID